MYKLARHENESKRRTAELQNLFPSLLKQMPGTNAASRRPSWDKQKPSSSSISHIDNHVSFRVTMSTSVFENMKANEEGMTLRRYRQSIVWMMLVCLSVETVLHSRPVFFRALPIHFFIFADTDTCFKHNMSGLYFRQSEKATLHCLAANRLMSACVPSCLCFVFAMSDAECAAAAC